MNFTYILGCRFFGKELRESRACDSRNLLHKNLHNSVSGMTFLPGDKMPGGWGVCIMCMLCKRIM